MSQDIAEIPGISHKDSELFRTAGLHSIGLLLGSPIERIMEELEEASALRGLDEEAPSLQKVESWIEIARTIHRPQDGLESLAPKKEAQGAKHARRISGQELMAAGVSVDAIPVAEFVGEKVKAPREEKLRIKSRATTNSQEQSKQKVVRKTKPAPISQERPDFARAGRVNGHPKDSSERRNSGMTHKDPLRVVVAAGTTLAAMVFGSLAGIAVLVLVPYFLRTSGQLPQWVLYLLAVIPASVIVYGLWGIRARCRLCGYRLFAPKSCLKHEKAHRSFLGIIFPTALRVLVRGNWRCMYCGTKQRLR